MIAAGDVANMLRRENKAVSNSTFLGAELNEVQLKREGTECKKCCFSQYECKLAQAGIVISVSGNVVPETQRHQKKCQRRTRKSQNE